MKVGSGTSVADMFGSSSPGAGLSRLKPSESARNAVAEFQHEASKTPLDRIKDSVLKKHDLSQEQFESLAQERRSAIQQEIEEAVKHAFKDAKSGVAPGSSANVLV